METIDYKFEVYKIFSSSCTICKNGFDKNKFICRAFPKGIPDKILLGKDKHAQPIKRQGNKVVFDAKK